MIVVRAIFHKNNTNIIHKFFQMNFYTNINNIKMLYYDRIDVFEGIDIKTSVSKQCDICHYWYFLNKGFKFQPLYAIDVMIY